MKQRKEHFMKIYRIISLAAFVILLSGGVAHAQREGDRWVKGRIGPQWELMTRQVVNFRDDRDHINVGNAGRHNGRFARVMVRAEGAPVEIRRMVINFDNGEKFEAINQRTRLDDNSGGLVIDLPGHRRDIDSIDLNYFSVNNSQRDGRGTLLVYGTGTEGNRDRAAASQNDRLQTGRMGGGWELVGKQVVNFRDDRDKIVVGDAGRHNGRFKQLQIRAEGAPIEIRRMVVRFDNNETMNAVSKRTRLDDNSDGVVIDLPGHRRDIKDIDIDYFSVNQREGRGTLLVYAR
jgi:hypothetical protein